MIKIVFMFNFNSVLYAISDNNSVLLVLSSAFNPPVACAFAVCVMFCVIDYSIISSTDYQSASALAVASSNVHFAAN